MQLLQNDLFKLAADSQAILFEKIEKIVCFFIISFKSSSTAKAMASISP